MNPSTQPPETEYSYTDLNPQRVVDLICHARRCQCPHVAAGAPVTGILCEHREIRELCAECYDRIVVGRLN